MNVYIFALSKYITNMMMVSFCSNNKTNTFTPLFTHNGIGVWGVHYKYGGPSACVEVYGMEWASSGAILPPFDGGGAKSTLTLLLLRPMREDCSRASLLRMELRFWLRQIDLSRHALKGNESTFQSLLFSVLKNIYIPVDVYVLTERSITTSAHGCRDPRKTLRFVLFE